MVILADMSIAIKRCVVHIPQLNIRNISVAYWKAGKWPETLIRSTIKIEIKICESWGE
jgi:hypothetical protein